MIGAAPVFYASSFGERAYKKSCTGGGAGAWEDSYNFTPKTHLAVLTRMRCNCFLACFVHILFGWLSVQRNGNRRLDRLKYEQKV